jgi:hypothetical protein
MGNSVAKIRTADGWTQTLGAAAGAILLEKSPIEADGGESIGRDPRRISANEFHEAGIAGAPLLEVIRARCLDCCVEQAGEVRKCVSIACPSWPYRMNANPFRNVNLTAAELERRRERGKALSMRAKAKFANP